MGSFDVIEISELSQSELPIWFPIGIILVTIGMFLKLQQYFPFWAPDVYEGLLLSLP
jgi:NADH-quinone oxidoreductase subunit N